jgi:hypothetical protein
VFREKVSRKQWIDVTFFSGKTQALLWITYSQTENILGSIGIRAGISISDILYRLSKLAFRKQQLLYRNLNRTQ